MEGFYTEGLLEPPQPAGDMSVPDDVRSLTAGGTGYRTAIAPVIDLDALIGDMEKRR